ncbi:unnamed protein product [Rotaria sp. Silwood1]|nr:unnamed protein product [Rotaria sp. Silwood1]CAF3571020.1 unnamed protein product [Rotaria sp. Silwood1]CAF5001318.1 unnamed protein product [Rotaria sp. Silwood1]CAF5005931.1 unnamed protein product [Rotaria sp. Silwood1]
MIPFTFQNRLKSISDLVKQNVYNQCKSFSQKSHSLEALQHNNRNNQFISSNRTTTLENVYLLLRYSPRRNDESGLYLQVATSYLLSQNLQQLSIQQQSRIRVAIFLSENYTHAMYSRLEQWFKSIYEPYTDVTHIIRTKNDYQASRKFMMNYTKYNDEVQLDTILFLLEDDYIFERDMLSDTIEFFSSHNPCFIQQTDDSDRCRLDMNENDGSITIVNGRTRLWRSISSTTVSYACRLKTFLAFEDILMHDDDDDFELRRKIRDRVGSVAIFCAIPSYGARLEALLLPNEINTTADIDNAAYFKDWWSFARHAVSEAQKQDTFPARKVNEQNLFLK